MTVRSSLVGCLVGLTSLLVTVASAQDQPGDVAVVAPDIALPDAPDDYRSEQIGAVRWDYPRQAQSLAHELQQAHGEEWPRIASELGGTIDDTLVIRIGRNHREMTALAPPRAPPPAYASGVAYPHRGLILLSLTAPSTNESIDARAVLVHELSHVALHRAVGGNPIPRWFTEGMAIHQAREKSFERVQTLWGATVGGRLLTIDQLEHRFPSGATRVDLAYAQSADFVDWLMGRPQGQEKLRDVIGRVREGQSFRTALERTYSASMTRLEIDWHDSLSERFQALPLLFGSGTLWVFAAFLIVIAYVRRRRKDREKFDEWAEEERASMAAAHSLLASRGAGHTTAGPSPTEPDDDLDVLYVVPPEPRAGDSGIPTVEHEGRSHTLH